MRWGRQRAPYVFIDLVDDGEPFSDARYDAGARDDGLPRVPFTLLPDAPPIDGYGGDVYLNDEASHGPTGSFVAVADDGAREVFADLDAAIDWARDRAPVVVASLLPVELAWPPPPTPRRYSAGAAEPPDETLARIRGREDGELIEWRAEVGSAQTAMRLADARVRSPSEVLERLRRHEAVLAAELVPPRARGTWHDDEPRVQLRIQAPTIGAAEQLALAAYLDALIEQTSGSVGWGASINVEPLAPAAGP